MINITQVVKVLWTKSFAFTDDMDVTNRLYQSILNSDVMTLVKK